MDENVSIYLSKYPKNFNGKDLVNKLEKFSKSRSNYFTKIDMEKFIFEELFTNYYDELDNLLKEFSKEHEGIFETTSYCIETDEYFRDYYKNGKCQTELGRIEFNEFDENKLV